MLKTLPEKVAPGTAALIVVDMQNDFCHPEGAGAVNGGDVTPCVEMAPRLKQLIAKHIKDNCF